MASITINVPDAVLPRVLNAICTRYGYTGFLADGVTAQTKSAFVKAWMITDIKNAIREQEAATAAANAYSTAGSDVDNNIILT